MEAGSRIAEQEISWRQWYPPIAAFQVVYLFAYIDRQVLSLLVGPIKASIGLSDVQIGLLQGFAFTAVYSLSSIFIAPIVDKGNRVRLVGLCMIVWCTMTVLSGFAQSFTTLLFARMGLAIAEAIIPVAVLSLICDIAPVRVIPRAAALFLMAAFVGSGLALLLGGPLLGTLAHDSGERALFGLRLEPWRWVFILVGAPGLLIGLAVMARIREPVRKRISSVGADESGSALAFFRQHWRYLLTLATFIAMNNTMSLTIYAWVPTLFFRVHDIAMPAAAVSVGTIYVVAGILGCLFGSWVMGRAPAHRALSNVVGWMLIACGIQWLPLILMPLVPSASAALALLALGFVCQGIILSSALTPLQLFTPSSVRGRITATCTVYSSLLSGLGPLAVGVMTDRLFAAPERISHAMALTFLAAGTAAFACGLLTLRMSRSISVRAGRLPALVTTS